MKKGILKTKKSLKLSVLLCLIGVMVVTSCSNDDDSDNTLTPITPVVYVAGYLESTVDVAAIWEDGVLTKLTDGTNEARASAVFVNKSDVYVAGYESNGSTNIAKVWKNGIATSLTDGTNKARALSVFVNGNDVYAAEYDVGSVAKVWENGKRTNLDNDGNQEAHALSIFVK